MRVSPVVPQNCEKHKFSHFHLSIVHLDGVRPPHEISPIHQKKARPDTIRSVQPKWFCNHGKNGVAVGKERDKYV